MQVLWKNFVRNCNLQKHSQLTHNHIHKNTNIIDTAIGKYQANNERENSVIKVECPVVLRITKSF